VTAKYFNVKNGLTTGTISLNAANGNITSNTYIGNVVVTNTANLGAVGNITITGGSANYVLQTNGSGLLSWVAQSTGGTTVTVDNFTGNGVQTAFTLSTTPSSINDTIVNYNGALVLRTAYSLAGAVLTFSSPPADQVEIEITTGGIGGGGGGGTSPGGSNTYVQFNDGSSFGGNAQFTYNKTTNLLSVGNVSLSGNIIPSSNNVYSLGNASSWFKDAYIGPGSLYVAGKKVLEDVSGTITFTTDINQNLKISDLAISAQGTGTVKINDDLTVTGNLIINGGVGNLSVSTLSVEDSIIDISAETTGTPSANAGIRVVRGDSSAVLLRWTETDDAWQFTNDGSAYLNMVGTTSTGNTSLGNVAIANYFSGNGSLLTGITAATAGTVTTNAQPNITSVGSLASLTVSGLITNTGTGIKTSNIQDSSGTITIVTGYGSVSGAVGIYGNITAGTSGTGFFIGNGSYLSGLAGANVTGTVSSATTAGTVTTNAQPNITSTGTLASLTVTGNITSGNANLGNLVTSSYFTGDGSLLTGLKPNLFMTVALSDETTAITTGVGKITFRAPFDMTLYQIPRAPLSTASSSGNPAIDINKNGTTIFSTTLTIDSGEKTSTTAATAAVLSTTTFADDDEITMDIDTAGTGATGLKVTLYYRRT